MINTVLHCLIPLITVWIVSKYLNIFFEKKADPYIFHILLWVCFYLYQVYIENHPISSLLILFLNIIFVFCISFLSYKGTIRSKISKVLLLWIFWMLAEYFTAATLSSEPLAAADSFLLGSVVSKLLVIISLQIVERRVQKGTYKIPWSYWLLLLFVPAGTIYISYTLFHLIKQQKESSLAYAPAFLLLLFINIIIFEVYEKIAHSLETEAENAIFEQQLELFTKQLEEQKKTYSAFRREQHDFVNQMIVIKNNIEREKTTQALATLDSLLHSCTEHAVVIAQSGNDVVDSILNYKYTIARQKEIDFKLNLFLPETLPFSQRDLSIILGNILDNAIEASQKAANPFIEASLGIRKDYFVFVAKNSFHDRLLFDIHGNLITTKAHKHLHGYGLSSVQKAAEHYGGQIITEYDKDKTNEDNIFTITVFMPLHFD